MKLLDKQALDAFFKSQTWVSWSKKKRAMRDLKQEIIQLSELANKLNHKYPVFPLFYLDVSNIVVSDIKALPRLQVNLKFKDFILLSYTLAPCLDADSKLPKVNKNQETLFYFHTFVYNDQQEHTLDRIAYLKQLDENTNLFNSFHSPYTMFAKAHYYFDINKNFISYPIANLLLNTDLQDLILLVLNPLDDVNALQTNKAYINSYYTNLLNRKHQIFTRQLNHYYASATYYAGFLNYTQNAKLAYTKYLLQSNIDNTNQPKWQQENEASWFNSLHYVNNISYNQVDGLVLLAKYQKGEVNLNDVRTMTQTLNFSAGLKHGTDIDFFYDPTLGYKNNKPINYYNLTRSMNFERSAYADPETINNDILFYYTDHKNTSSKLIHVITLSDIRDLDHCVQVSLNTTNQLQFLQEVFKQTVFNKTATNTYSEDIANVNLKKFTQACITQLINLPILFPNKTIKTLKQLQFKQDNTSIQFDHTRTFLTFNPLPNPNLNYHIILGNLYERRMNFLQDRVLYAQDINHVMLCFNTSLIEISYKALQDTDYHTGFVFYVYFTNYLYLFFTKYILFSKEFGYILHCMNYETLLYGYIKCDKEDTEDELITNKNIEEANAFYSKFLTAFFQIFTSIDFIRSFAYLFRNNEDAIIMKQTITTVPKEVMTAKSFKEQELAWNIWLFDMLNNSAKYSSSSIINKDMCGLSSNLRLFEVNFANNNHEQDPFLLLIHTYMQKVVELIPDLEIRPMKDYETYLKKLDSGYNQKENAMNTTKVGFSNTKRNRL